MKKLCIVLFALLLSFEVFAIDFNVEKAEIAPSGDCQIYLATKTYDTALMIMLPANPETLCSFGLLGVKNGQSVSLLSNEALLVYDLRSNNDWKFALVPYSAMGSAGDKYYYSVTEELFEALFAAAFEYQTMLWRFVNGDKKTVYNLYFSISEGKELLQNALSVYYLVTLKPYVLGD